MINKYWKKKKHKKCHLFIISSDNMDQSAQRRAVDGVLKMR